MIVAALKELIGLFVDDDLGEFAGRKAAESIHLPEAVLRGEVALDEKSVLQAGGADVRFSARIESYRCSGGNRGLDLSRMLRKGSPDEPIEQREHEGGDPSRGRAPGCGRRGLWDAHGRGLSGHLVGLGSDILLPAARRPAP